MLQCVAVCCSVLQCVAVCCSALQCVALCCSVLHCVAVCCSVFPLLTCVTYLSADPAERLLSQTAPALPATHAALSSTVNEDSSVGGADGGGAMAGERDREGGGGGGSGGGAGAGGEGGVVEVAEVCVASEKVGEKDRDADWGVGAVETEWGGVSHGGGGEGENVDLGEAVGIPKDGWQSLKRSPGIVHCTPIIYI